MAYEDPDVARILADAATPPPPDFVNQPHAWQAWFKKYVACEQCPMARSPGSPLCRYCLAEGRKPRNQAPPIKRRQARPL